MICFHQTNIVCYARQNLLAIAPNVETLTISSLNEMVNTPMLSSKFLHLKLLQISLVGMPFSGAYDYLSLVSFLDASPCLENFVLAGVFGILVSLEGSGIDIGPMQISQHRMQHASILGEPSHDLRQIPEQHHDKLKSVTITGFCSAKSLVELTSLDCLTLDTTCHPSCSVTKLDKCHPLTLMDGDSLVEAQKALLAIRKYIVGKVPPMVKLTIFGALQPMPYC